MRVNFTVTGLSGLARNLYAIDAEVRRDIPKAVRKYGTNVRDGAKARSRVDTGKQRDKIQDTYSEQGLVAHVGWDYADFVADGDAFYPIFNEFGTSRMPAQPMIGPAHAEHAPQLTRDVGNVIRGAIERRRVA